MSSIILPSDIVQNESLPDVSQTLNNGPVPIPTQISTPIPLTSITTTTTTTTIDTDLSLPPNIVFLLALSATVFVFSLYILVRQLQTRVIHECEANQSEVDESLQRKYSLRNFHRLKKMPTGLDFVIEDQEKEGEGEDIITVVNVPLSPAGKSGITDYVVKVER